MKSVGSNPFSYDEIPLNTEEQVRKYLPRNSETGIFWAIQVATWPRVPANSLGIHGKNQLKTFPMEYIERGIVNSIDWRGRLCTIIAKGTDKNRIPLDIHTFGPGDEVHCYSCYFYPGENKKRLSSEWGEWLSNHIGIDILHKMPQCPSVFSIDDADVTNRNSWLKHYVTDNSACKGIDKTGCRYIAVKIQHFDEEGEESRKFIELIYENSPRSNSYKSISIGLDNVKSTYRIFESDEDFNALKNLLNGEEVITSQIKSGYIKIC